MSNPKTVRVRIAVDGDAMIQAARDGDFVEWWCAEHGPNYWPGHVDEIYSAWVAMRDDQRVGDLSDALERAEAERDEALRLASERAAAAMRHRAELDRLIETITAMRDEWDEQETKGLLVDDPYAEMFGTAKWALDRALEAAVKGATDDA